MFIHNSGKYLPEQIIRNDQLTQFPKGAIPLIAQKTGILSRRHAAKEQCTSDLAANAAIDCLTKSNLDAASIDGIILATSSPDRIQPATATRVQHLIGAKNAFAFDVNSVCSGGIFALAAAKGFFQTGLANNMIVVASEVYSRFLNPSDFSTYPYFGDGAGAVLASNQAEGSLAELVDTVLHTDGSGSEVIQIPAGGTMKPADAMNLQKDSFFSMKGKEVYQFAVEKGSAILEEITTKNGLSLSSVAHVITHQANINIIQEISRRTEIDQNRFFVNLSEYGNTAGASVMIALDEFLSRGIYQAGDYLVLVAFGGGLSWGATLLRLNERRTIL